MCPARAGRHPGKVGSLDSSVAGVNKAFGAADKGDGRRRSHNHGIDQPAKRATNNIEQGLGTIHADVRRTEKTLTQMEKCCGCCLCPYGRSKNYDKDARHIAAFSQDHKQDAEQSGGAVGLSCRGKGSTAYQGSNEPYIQHITNDVRENEMEANMEAISGAMGNLKNMALDMGAALEGQNRPSDRINAKAEITNES